MKRFVRGAQPVVVGLTVLALAVCAVSWDAAREWAATGAYVGFAVLAALRMAAEFVRGRGDAA